MNIAVLSIINKSESICESRSGYRYFSNSISRSVLGPKCRSGSGSKLGSWSMFKHRSWSDYGCWSCSE